MYYGEKIERHSGGLDNSIVSCYLLDYTHGNKQYNVSTKFAGLPIQGHSANHSTFCISVPEEDQQTWSKRCIRIKVY